jgi:hypothetical protein
MKRTLKHEIESVAAGRGVRRHLLAGLLVVCGGLATVIAADQAHPLDTNAVTATAASSQTNALPEPLPLMIPDDVWKRLTLRDEQKAQLTALRTSLYSDQLATVQSITLQGETLRLALMEAKQTVESGKGEGGRRQKSEDSGQSEAEEMDGGVLGLPAAPLHYSNIPLLPWMRCWRSRQTRSRDSQSVIRDPWRFALRRHNQTMVHHQGRNGANMLENQRWLEHGAAVSKVEQIEVEMQKLSRAELRQVRDWLDDVIEDGLEFTPEFEAAIRESEREMAEGLRPRVRQP